ncbi:hypothetical protein ACHAXT_004411 [Thalassiosira profunda]
MSAPPASLPAPGDRPAAEAPRFTPEGLPLDVATASPATADAGDGGPSRRVEVRQPQLLAAPTAAPAAKRPPAEAAKEKEAPRTPALAVGPNRSSLVDGDDDAVVDYFCASDGAHEPQATTSSAAPSGTAPWPVRESHVPTLPSFYPLEKSAAFVPQASAAIIAGRIAAVLQARSIAAKFDPEHAKADCVSPSLVEFRVRLYRGRGGYRHGLIAEVQRRCGFSPGYAQDVYAILDAAEGKNTAEEQEQAAPIYYDDGGCSSSDDEEDMDALENTGGFASLRVISDILCPLDESQVTAEGQDFALASLASLTSLDRMGPAAAQVSDELLASDAHEDLRQAIASHLAVAPEPQGAPRRSTLQSLEVLAHAAAALPDKAPLVAFLFQNDLQVLRALIVHVEQARSDPPAAARACAILDTALGAAGAEVPSSLRERLLAALLEAANCGGECHAGLEGEARGCLGRLV